MWTVPARRRRLSAIRSADRRRRRADGVRRLVIFDVEDLSGRGGRDGRSGGRCGSRRGRSRGCGRRGRCGSGRRRGCAPRRLQLRTLLTYVAIVAAVVTGVSAATAARLAHHVHEELRSGESADLRGAEGLMETRKRLLRNGLPLRLESLARVPGVALLLLARNCAFLRLKLAYF